jgi:hypothetical protein
MSSGEEMGKNQVAHLIAPLLREGHQHHHELGAGSCCYGPLFAVPTVVPRPDPAWFPLIGAAGAEPGRDPAASQVMSRDDVTAHSKSKFSFRHRTVALSGLAAQQTSTAADPQACAATPAPSD